MRRLIILILLLLGIAPRLEAAKFLDAIGPADRAILDDLYNGRIIEAAPFGANQNTGSLWKVKLEHQGRIRQAMFRPRSPGDREGWARTPMEVATYKLNRVLGLDVVPPTAYRRNLWLNGQQFAEGALMLWVDDAHGALNVARDQWKPGHEPFASDLRLMQIMMADADHENGNNIIRGKHWKDGKYRVMKVDNEACLRPGAYLRLEHNSAIWGQVNRFNEHTVNRMRELNFGDLKADLGEFMSDHEIGKILSIRDGLVAHIDHLVRERGRERVFFSQHEINFDARLRVGQPASRKQVAKFERLLQRKGVTLEYVSAGSLKRALGTTQLRPDGITVKIARSRKGPRLQTLIEELVHVNQLQSMARRAGGLPALHTSLQQDRRRARVIGASMEAYAKGKLTSSLRGNTKDLRKVTRAQRRFERRVERTVPTRDPGRFWRAATSCALSSAPGRGAPASRAAR